MTPPIPARVRALQRDLRIFNERVARVAGELDGPLPPTRDRETLARVMPLYAAADRLRHRARSLERTGADQALEGVRDLLDMGINAARTVTQRTLVGREGHAETTVSVARGSERSAGLWDRVRRGHDLPDARIVGRIAPPALALVADRLENAPQGAIDVVDALGARAALFGGKLTDVYGYRYLRGQQPRGWPAGKTWDIVPGAGGDTGFAANPNRELTGRGHSSTSLVLHEYGHTIDHSMARPIEAALSDGERFRRGAWREMRRREAPSNYVKAYPSEWFAEAFARYTKSPQSTASLARWYPQTYSFLRRELGAPQFAR